MPLTTVTGSVSASLLPVSGATMTGPLLLSQNPTLPLHAASKQYCDSITGALPTQTGQSGKFLTTNGTIGSWVNISGGDATNNIGYLNVPQNSQSAAYTLVLSDAGKQIYHPSADTTARTWTIPSNASVAFPIGTAITFINDTSAGAITIAITSDTMVLAGAGTTGSRTLAANGMATAIKTTATRWMISGTGLT